MAQVPYTGVPEVSPTKQGLPGIQTATPEAAFGGASAAAGERFGGELRQVGDELFARAIAMQQLDNESKARDADVQYMIQSGELHAKFSSLEGEAAVRAYPQYAKDLQTLQKKIRDGLGNDQTRKMFDSYSKNTMGRAIFNGAGRAASENRQWNINSAKSQAELDLQAIEDDPNNEGAFLDKLGRIRQSARQVAMLSGADNGPIMEATEKSAVSKAWSSRIIGMSRTDPIKAVETLAKNKKFLNEADYLRVDNSVRSQARAVGAANIANEVYAGGVETPERPAKPLKDMEAEAEEKAKKAFPDDPIAAQHAVTTLRGKYNQSKYAEKQEQAVNASIVNDAILKGVKNEQELRADPKVAAAIDALPEKERLALPGRINRYNESRDKAANEQAYTTLRGLASNDVEQFLNTDYTDEKFKLSQNQIRSLNDIRAKLIKQTGSDPRVNKATSLIRGSYAAQLEALGIYRRTEQNKDDYDHYTGALQAALEDYQETNKKPADDKTILNDIAPKVLQQRTEVGWLWNSKKAFFQQTVPEDFATAARASANRNGEPEPTDQQIYQSFLRFQWKTLNKSAPKSGSAPSVPQSR